LSIGGKENTVQLVEQVVMTCQRETMAELRCYLLGSPSLHQH